MYVFFGWNAGNALSTSYVYDPAGNSWVGTTSLPGGVGPARYGAACAVIGNLMYAYGGRDQSGAPLSDFLTFNFATTTWSAVVGGGTPPNARHDATLTAVTLPSGATNLYLIAGGSAAVVPNLAYNSVYEYRPVGNTWALKTPTGGPPGIRYGHGADNAGLTRVVIQGGFAGTLSGLSPNDYYNDVWEYDAFLNTWTQVTITNPALSSPRFDSSWTVIQGTTTFLQIGGVDKLGNTMGDFNTNSYTPLVCPAGQFSPDGQTACAACAAGSYAPTTNSYSCTTCPVGSYCSGTGNSAFTYCPGGRYGVGTGGATSAGAGCTNCPATTYVALGPPLASSVSACLPCPIGTASNTAGVSVCPTCGAGTYTSAVGQGTCSNCLPGNSCSSGIMTPCAASSAQNLGSQSTCNACATGSWASGGALTCTGCLPGTYSSTASPAATSIAVCQSCGAGTYNNATGQPACFQCPAGTWSSSTGNSLLSQCNLCPAGTSSLALGATSLSTCTSCVAGSYALAGQGTCTLCGPGTYNPVNGSTSAAACLTCPAGTSNALSGATSVTQCTGCAPGTYSNGGSCTPCPAGTYSALASASSIAECLPCPHNSISPSGSPQCFECSPGTVAVSGSTYCETCATNAALQFAYTDLLTNRHFTTSPTTTSFTGWTVNAGSVGRTNDSYTLAGSTSADYALNITASTSVPTVDISQLLTLNVPNPSRYTLAFSFFVKTTAVTGAPDNNFAASLDVVYSDASTKSYYVQLPMDTAGAWVFKRSFANSELGITTATLRFVMKGGHVGQALIDSASVVATTKVACACDPGLYNLESDMTYCIYCPLGNACVLSTKFACTGTTHAFGGREVCDPCPAGAYCLSGRAYSCPDTSYPDPVGKASCLPCPSGYKCPSGILTACGPGTYGTGTSRCWDCTEGTYQPGSTTSSCLTCPNGKTSSRKASACTNCPVGTYSTLGAPCASCQRGTYNNVTGAGACSPCPKGYYAPQDAYITCTKCPTGKTTASTGAYRLEDCV